MKFNFYDLLGTVGTILIIGTYILLQIGRIRSEQLVYSLLNACGALLIIVSLTHSFNFSAFVVEFFWVLISLYGIVKFFWKRS